MKTSNTIIESTNQTQNFSNQKYQLPLILISLAFSLFYIISACPIYGWRDGPELSVTATFLDVAHPAGFPTFNTLAKILTWLPLGSLGFKVTIFSALAGSLTIYITGLLLVSLASLDQKQKPSISWLFLALPLLALHRGIWDASTEVEVYSLNVAFLALLFFLATRWQSGGGIHWLYAGGFLYGLACGNHAALSLYLPVLLLLAFLKSNKFEFVPKTNPFKKLIILITVFLGGLSIYLMLLIRSQTDTLPMDFGRTNSLIRLWWHITDAKGQDMHFNALINFESLIIQLKAIFKKITSPLFWAGLPFIIWGTIYLWRRLQTLMLALISLIIINIGFFYYWIDGISAFPPSILAGFIFLALGLGQFGRFLNKLGLSLNLNRLIALVVIIPILIFIVPQRFQSRETLSGFQATEIFWPDLANVPPESLILQNESYFFSLALQNLYVARPDVSVIMTSGLTNPKFFAPPIPKKFPLITFPLLTDGSEASAFHPDFIDAFLNANFEQGHDIFLNYGSNLKDLVLYSRPEKGLMWLGRLNQNSSTAKTALKDGTFDAYLNWVKIYIRKQAGLTNPPLNNKAPSFFFYALRAVYEYIMQTGDYQKASEIITDFLSVLKTPDGSWPLTPEIITIIHGSLAECLLKSNNLKEAELVSRKLIELDSSAPPGWYFLAETLERAGRGEEALEVWQQCLTKDPEGIYIFYHYAQALAKYRSLETGIRFLENHAKYLLSQDRQNLGKIAIHLSNCLKLPPEEPVFILEKETPSYSYQ